MQEGFAKFEWNILWLDGDDISNNLDAYLGLA
jgi:hypothetical protein